MSIEIKKSEKPVIYEDAKKMMEERLLNVDQNKSNELIWTLEHPDIYTAGTSYNESDILDKSIKILETNRGGKITYHGPGQLICYFVIDLKKRKKDIRNFITIIEKTIIDTLQFFNIKTFSDKENIGIWYKDNEQTKKVAAIGVRISKWIAYHGFSININNNLDKYKAIIPCGIKDKGVTNLKQIKDQDYNELDKKLVEIFISNLNK
ncbi:lipoyl(octanoyl) transferase LipB [Candidatus Pelagibacter sp.]|uniref:lipoyl(octanoyl) transferase LipB n=1 Tax=Candidatus Pelagibacter sp. TaxID=2024849 RepID=UPI003F831BFE